MAVDVAGKPVGSNAGELEPPVRGVSARGGGQRCQRGRVLQTRAPRAGQRLPLQPGAGRPGRLHSLLSRLRVRVGEAVSRPRPPAGGSILHSHDLHHYQAHGWVSTLGSLCEWVGEHIEHTGESL